MIYGLYIGALLLSFALSKLVFKTLKTPITFFSILWCIVGFTSNLGLYDYYPPSTYVNIVILGGVVVFDLAFSIMNLKRRRIRVGFQTGDFEHVNKNAFWVINWLAIAFESIFFIRAMLFLVSTGFNFVALRAELNTIINSEGIIGIIRDNVIKVIFVATAIFSIVNMYTNNSRAFKQKVLFLAIVENVEYSITNAARGTIVNFITYMLIAILLFSSDGIIRAIKDNKKLVSVFAVLLVVFLFLQSGRKGGALTETFYVYYFSGPQYLTNLLEDSSSFHVNSEFLWGTATFGFVTNIYYYFETFLFGINRSTIKLVASVLTIKQYNVSPGHYINAMCTGFYPFLLDWGDWGIVIGPIVLAAICSIIYKGYKKNNNLFFSCMYIYLLHMLIRTLFKWDFINIDLTVLTVILWVYFAPKKTISTRGF